MFEALVFFATVCILLLANFHWKRRNLVRHASKFRGPKPYPIIGNGNLFLWKNNEENFEIVNNLFKTYESPLICWLGPEPFILIDNPEDIQTVLNSPNCLSKANVYGFLRCENGLFSIINSNKWKKHRKFLNPCFNKKISNGFIEIMNDKSRILVERMSENLENNLAFDLYRYIGGFTLDSIVGNYNYIKR